MSPVLGIFASGITNSKLGSFESIQTVTVGSGGASSVSFTSIPSTYSHLQIRLFGQTNRATYGLDDVSFRCNGDTGANYAWHYMYGNGSSAASTAGASQTVTAYMAGVLGTTTGGQFGTVVLDVLNYSNTNKYKTLRGLGGTDMNGVIAGYGGYVTFASGLWMNTTAINSITIQPGSSLTNYTHAALYGIKG